RAQRPVPAAEAERPLSVQSENSPAREARGKTRRLRTFNHGAASSLNFVRCLTLPFVSVRPPGIECPAGLRLIGAGGRGLLEQHDAVRCVATHQLECGQAPRRHAQYRTAARWYDKAPSTHYHLLPSQAVRQASSGIILKRSI